MMSRSQSSLSFAEAGKYEQPAVPPNQHQAASASSGPINLSGLVCNVRRTTGREPHPLVGATTTILGDKLYVFGGRVLSQTRPRLSSDLYELDLVRRHWTKVEATGDIPPPRYFHSVCALGDNKLVCYGGMSPATNTHGSATNGDAASQNTQPEVMVMSDVHIFDVPSRIWTRVSAIDSPQCRYAHCAAILPSSAYFSSVTAPLSAVHRNHVSPDTHRGSIGAETDGFGGAEMVVVGGQDSANNYIEQISVFNLRSLKWTSTSLLGKSCGAYRSVATPLINMHVSEIGSAADDSESQDPIQPSRVEGCPMLIYTNYNFLNVKLELQVRLPDGQLIEKRMPAQASPPGLRFPNGGVINGHLVVSGTYLTSSKQEYALWALDLRTLTWGRIDAGGLVFGHGSWNRGVLWSRRSTFVILGHRKRNLVEDYNHRRLNFSHVCMVELEAFGLYDNPCRTFPTSAYISHSSPSVPVSLQPKLWQLTTSGKPFTSASYELGKVAESLLEIADMELQAVGGECIPVNSRILCRRWGPYFIRLLRESRDGDTSDNTALRPNTQPVPSRNSSITITPSLDQSDTTTLVSSSAASKSILANLEVPSTHSLSPVSRSRVLYLPHTILTLQALVHYLYTFSLHPPGSPLCTPQVLCSLLQLARPYQVCGLLEATIERLHQVLDDRNAAAIFNAAAMAAGGGRGTGFTSGLGGTLEVLNGAHTMAPSESPATHTLVGIESDSPEGGIRDAEHGASSDVASASSASIRINTNVPYDSRRDITNDGNSDHSIPASTSSASFSNSESEMPSSAMAHHTQASSYSDSQQQHAFDEDAALRKVHREIWTGDLSCVIGLQKRGLRGLMEGRRLRERSSNSNPRLVHPSSTITAAVAAVAASGDSLKPEPSNAGHDAGADAIEGS